MCIEPQLDVADNDSSNDIINEQAEEKSNDGQNDTAADSLQNGGNDKSNITNKDIIKEPSLLDSLGNNLKIMSTAVFSCRHNLLCED